MFSFSTCVSSSCRQKKIIVPSKGGFPSEFKTSLLVFKSVAPPSSKNSRFYLTFELFFYSVV